MLHMALVFLVIGLIAAVLLPSTSPSPAAVETP